VELEVTLAFLGAGSEESSTSVLRTLGRRQRERAYVGDTGSTTCSVKQSPLCSLPCCVRGCRRGPLGDLGGEADRSTVVGAGAGAVGEEEDPGAACSSLTDSVAGSLEDSPSPRESVPLEDFGAVGSGVGEETVEDGDR
jgi:hypothetical protein